MNKLYDEMAYRPLLIQNGKQIVNCLKCKQKGLPHVKKSHMNFLDKTQLFKVECAYCCSYIKFINEFQEQSGDYNVK